MREIVSQEEIEALFAGLREVMGEADFRGRRVAEGIASSSREYSERDQIISRQKYSTRLIVLADIR
jgi:hypothetical protein